MVAVTLPCGSSSIDCVWACPTELPLCGTVITAAGAGGGPGPGGSHGPYDLYLRFQEELPQIGIAVLSITYRAFSDMAVAVEDCSTAIDWVMKQKAAPIMLIGWSMGGAAVIEAAHRHRQLGKSTIRGVITIGGQSKGAKNIKQLNGIPILLLHGGDDTCIGPGCARRLFELAKQPKQVEIFPGEDHGIASAHDFLWKWIPPRMNQLPKPGVGTASKLSSLAGSFLPDLVQPMTRTLSEEGQQVVVDHLGFPTCNGNQCTATWTHRKGDTEHHCMLITVAGAGGGPGPGGSFGPYELFSRLAEVLPQRGISVLQVTYSSFGDVGVGVADCLSCVSWAKGPVMLIGWSMGGAVVIEAGVQCKPRAQLRGVITIGGQSMGTKNVAQLAGTPLLILHGGADTCIAPRAANMVYNKAKNPKEVIVFPNEDHGVPSALQYLTNWIPGHFPVGEVVEQLRQPSLPKPTTAVDPTKPFVVYVMVGGKLVPMDVTWQTTIGQIKHALKREGALVFGGVRLEGALSVKEAGVSPESTLRFSG